MMMLLVITYLADDFLVGLLECWVEFAPGTLLLLLLLLHIPPHTCISQTTTPRRRSLAYLITVIAIKRRTSVIIIIIIIPATSKRTCFFDGVSYASLWVWVSWGGRGMTWVRLDMYYSGN